MKFNNSIIEQISKDFDTPTYVYSQQKILEQLNKIKFQLRTNDLICFAVKANSNLSILNLLASENIGFDVVSLGELKRVIAAGGKPSKTVFSGVGKKSEEIEFALNKGILCLNVESEDELYLIEQIAKKNNYIAPVSIRINPNVNAKTHPYISTALKNSKFGIDIKQAKKLYEYIARSQYLNAQGIDFHIGSQILDIEPLTIALKEVLEFYQQLKQTYNIQIPHLDIGGGYGINYENQQSEFNIKKFFAQVYKIIPNDLKIICEPGRYIVGNSGVLVTKVIRTKQNFSYNYAIVDAAMNDILRPSLYQAYHKIEKLQPSKNPSKTYDIVGPVCETGDFIARNYSIPELQKNDILLVHSAGAYCFSMSSNYNSRNRCAEVLIDNYQYKLIRKRESFEDLIAHEKELFN